MSGGIPTSLFHALRGALHATGLDEKRCAACLAPYSPVPGSSLPLCAGCVSLLPRKQTGFCPRCGEPSLIAPLPAVPLHALSEPAPPMSAIPCGSCLATPPPWTEFRFYGVFEGLLRDLLHRAKYGSDAAALDVMGRLLAEICVDLPRPDSIVPMALHPNRLRHRGFNQSKEFARPLARLFGVPIQDSFLQRQRHVRPQTGLSRQERCHNLDGAFAASPAVSGLHLLLIDDTATTGTSLRRAADALLQAGARRVDVAVIAHASLHHPII